MNLTLNDLNSFVYSELSDEQKDFIVNEIKNFSSEELMGLYRSCKASNCSTEEMLNKIVIVDAFLDNRVRTYTEGKEKFKSWFTGLKAKIICVSANSCYPIKNFGVIYTIEIIDKDKQSHVFKCYEDNLI